MGLRLGQFASLIVCVVVLLACSDEHESCTYSFCDIKDIECAEDAARAVTCHMDESLSLPTISYRTRADLLAEFEASQVELTDDEKMIEWALHERNQLFGFEPEGYDEEDSYSDYLDSLTAFYDISEAEIVILDGGADDLENNYLILVHELVHAVQDQTWGLKSLDEQYAYTTDRALGLKSLYEGEANLYEALADLELRNTSAARVDWAGYFSDWQQSELTELQTTVNPGLYIKRSLPYAYGMEFVFDARQVDGRAAIEALYAEPPDSSRAVMLGYDFWVENGTNLNRDFELDTRGAPIMPTRFELVGVSHAGVWYLQVMLQRTGGSGFRWQSMLDGLTSDVMTIFADPQNEEVVAVWRVAGSQSTDDFADALYSNSGSIWKTPDDLEGAPATHVMGWSGDDLVLVATTGSDASTIFDIADDWQSIEEMQMQFNDDDVASGGGSGTILKMIREK